MKAKAGPAVTVDVILFTVREGELSALMVRRGVAPEEGLWALPGGFVRLEESLDEAAARELREEAGIEAPWMEQLYTFGAVDRDPHRRAISVAYFALVDAQTLAEPQGGSDAAEARWLSMREIEALPRLAFDHRAILKKAKERLRYKLEYTPVAFHLLPERFTLAELQQVYEGLLGRPLDRRNFRRKLLALGIVEDTGERKQPQKGRPARLYAFRMERFKALGGGVILDF